MRIKFINKNTTFFFSISNNPSERGSIFYNNLFKNKKKNFLYVPIKINNNSQFKKFFLFLKTKIINTGGMSISMPFKSTSLKFANSKHYSAIKSKNTNTIIFKKKKVLAYNSDFLAAKKILKKNIFNNYLIIGAGSLASTFLSLLKNKKVYIFNRSKKNVIKILKIYKTAKNLNKSNSRKLKNICVINAAPYHDNKKLLNMIDLNEIKYICDCVIGDKNIFKSISKKKKIKYTDGMFFYKIQRNYQKKIYLNEKI
tara:strand:- start:508 stop:1272 length:765 start_codon:yes stop_codon:yes gene_type:complete